MADDSRLDYLRTFIAAVHTDATVKHCEEVSKIEKINDTERIFINEGVIMQTENYNVTLRYKIDISADSEINLSTAHNNILIGIRKLKTWTAIGGYTRESTLHHIDFIDAKLAEFNKKTKIWTQTIELQVTWGLSL